MLFLSGFITFCLILGVLVFVGLQGNIGDAEYTSATTVMIVVVSLTSSGLLCGVHSILLWLQAVG